MIEKLEKVVERYKEIELELSKPSITEDQKKYLKLTKEFSDITPLVNKYEEYKIIKSQYEDAIEMLHNEKDSEIKALAHSESEELSKKLKDIEDVLMNMLIPRDPKANRNVIFEIRAGTGGEEAALFAADLFKMYSRYIEKKGWDLEIMNSNITGTGGFKEIIFNIIGKDVYGRLKFESGVHRVQRVPETESSGRIHTSAVTVAVLPEAEESELIIEQKDLRIDVYRSSGPGGQSVNTTDSAVRITHLPSGIVVSCQDEKSQLKNKSKAMKVLRSRLLEQKEFEEKKKISEERRKMVGTGDRSERIRTYNFPESRVTDHRIKLTLYSLNDILAGELDVLIEPLLAEEKIKLMEGL